MIGPERQLDLYEAYLKSVEGTDGRLYRLYPRDLWMVAGVNYLSVRLTDRGEKKGGRLTSYPLDVRQPIGVPCPP